MDSPRDPNAYMPSEAQLGEIRTHIAEYNSERPRIHRSCINMAYVMMGGYALLAVFVIYLTWNIDEKGKVFGIVLVLLGAGGCYLWDYVWRPLKDHQLTLRYRLFPKVFAFIEKVQYSVGREPGFLQDLRQLKLIEFTSTENDDLVTGTHEGLDFELVETKLIAGSGKSKQTVFSGLIFHFRLATPFPGMLVAAKRGNWLERTMREFWGTTFNELASGNLRLDESHEFRSNNHQAARPVIAGALTSALIWLGNEWHAGDVRIALSHDDGYLMLPSEQDYFALPELEYDVRYESDVKPIIREMVMLLAVAHMMRQVA